MKPALTLIAMACALANAIAQSTNESASVIAPDAKLQKLAGDFKFTEGPTCNARGDVFFTDQPNNRIMKWSIEGELSTFLQPAGRANGMYFEPGGNLIACADDKTELWSIDPQGKHLVLAKEFDSKPLNAPNDVYVGRMDRFFSPIRSTNGRGGIMTSHRREPNRSTFCRLTERS